jgi:hypothetical protein
MLPGKSAAANLKIAWFPASKINAFWKGSPVIRLQPKAGGGRGFAGTSGAICTTDHGPSQCDQPGQELW